MPNNPWVAIDATASPSRRARELRRICDDYLSGSRLDRVRLPIAESWRHSEVAGIDPSRSRAPTMLADRDRVCCDPGAMMRCIIVDDSPLFVNAARGLL